MRIGPVANLSNTWAVKSSSAVEYSTALLCVGGRGGIRTLEGITPLAV